MLAVPERLMQEYSPDAQESFYVPAEAREEVCRNLILNSQLDVVDIGGGSFTAMPWEVLNPILYYTDDNPATPTPTHTPTETPKVTPTPTPGLPAPVIFDILNEGNRNSYDVGWSSVVWADWYRLDENRNDTTWKTVYEGLVTSINRSNMAEGQYCYRVKAYNAETYSNYSNEKCTVVGSGIPLTQRGFLPFVVGE